MREIVPVALLCLVTVQAVAQQTESITVEASALVGPWELTRPNYLGKTGIFGDWKWGPPKDSFCRIEPVHSELTIRCLNNDAGTVVVDGDHIHFAWGTMMARMVIDGVFRSEADFTGHAEAKLAGISLEDPGLSSGSKVNPAPVSDDKAGEAALLRTILIDGLEKVPHQATIKDSSAVRETLGLGNVQAVAYLGQQNKFGGPKQQDILDFYSVYAVEFESGERICGLHQRGDGTLDAFHCT